MAQKRKEDTARYLLTGGPTQVIVRSISRGPRHAPGGFVYHVLNRAVARLPLFEKPADYARHPSSLACGRFAAHDLPSLPVSWLRFPLCRPVARPFGGDRGEPGSGIAVRRVEDITEALWRTQVSPSTISELNQKIYVQIEARRHRPIEGE